MQVSRQRLAACLQALLVPQLRSILVAGKQGTLHSKPSSMLSMMGEGQAADDDGVAQLEERYNHQGPELELQSHFGAQ